MTDSANSCRAKGLRARKREATRSAITAAARLFTAQKGLNGFTIEQLCEEVGVSRRTFFNYFPSKEDAIIGHLLDEFPADATADFLAGGGPDVDRGPLGLSVTLLADLHTLTCAMVEELNFTREHFHELLAAMKKEPALMMKVMGSAHTRELEFSELIALREALPPDDPVAGMAAALFGMCSQRASKVFFSEENTAPYGDLLAANLLSAQKLFNFSHLTFEGTP
ncbi:TetR/AcrR family transcriptional regulator [Arthrobacter sp. PAMC 25486]|uniref:TetR/AcrR family transcriptional regulator n=1 Tax=Arthrobacter sp. PAMC 25486 TaxID=1494608 RepID=UPI0005708929|nr:TetR/AcrR family transcriptional regulator [Arthrobacter sp. PAMC 25486]